jgi:hypothetical protein
MKLNQGRSWPAEALIDTSKASLPSTTFRGLVKEIAAAIGKRRPVLGVHPELGSWLTRAVGWAKGDVMLTRHEIRDLMAELLYEDAHPACWTRLSD